VFTVVRIFKEVSEVGQMVKASHETCDNCLGYGNKTDPPVGILPYLKTMFYVLKHSPKHSVTLARVSHAVKISLCVLARGQ